MKNSSFFLITLLFIGCTNYETTKNTFDVQGHRGCRGLMLENSIEGFIKAIDLGVTTIEMDVVITKDNQVILSHEPFFSSTICTDSLGNKIDKKNERKWNIYSMNYAEIQKFDCGSLPNAEFPEQEKIKVLKPLLADVIDRVEKHIKDNNLKPVNYNIEIKGGAKNEELMKISGNDTAIFFPKHKEFAQLVIDVINKKGIKEKTIIQCFDIYTLREVKEIEPTIKISQLIHYGNQLSHKLNIQNLSFKPDIYSPEKSKITPMLMEYMKREGIKVIPWTVNDFETMVLLLEMGVDGIITDYPDRLLAVLETYSE